MLGTIVELCRARLAPPFKDGLSIVFGSSLDGLRDAGRNAALAGAAAVAIARAWDVALSPPEAATLCQRVENDWLRVPFGIGDAVCVLSGESHTLTEVRSDSGTIGGSIRLPDSLALMGIDCGVRRPDAVAKYENVRTAAFMGRALIDRIIQHEGAHDLQWDGRLARIAASDYVARFRDRLPTKLAGSEYLERFGETGDPLTRVDPALVYKIRSRTEHHIYEHARACEFVECLSRAIRNKNESVLAKVGGLMYASHWSYGQRCGLGSVETDLLVNLIRKHASDAGVYGAKASARGCGGVVTVLMQSTDRAFAAVKEAVDRYEKKSEREATLIRGSSHGAFAFGVRES
jgi:L-arabinokinase